jgi:hypothetical protein
MDNDEALAPDSARDVEPISTASGPESEPAVEPIDADSPSESSADLAPVVRPVSETIGTGSFFGIGCTIFALLFVCVGVAIFMWRQVN